MSLPPWGLSTPAHQLAVVLLAALLAAVLVLALVVRVVAVVVVVAWRTSCRWIAHPSPLFRMERQVR